MTSDSNSVFIGPDDVAKMLGLSKQVILKWTKAGKIPCLRFNKRVIRYRQSDIDAWWKSHEQSS